MPNKKGPNKQRGKNKFLGDEEKSNSLRNNTIHPTCVIAGDDIVEHAVIGEGFFATVKVGRWIRHDKKEKKVAIKCIKEEMVRDHLGEILTEANNMVKLEHDNVIKLYGICLVTRESEQCKVKLVTEFAPFGSLIAVIQDKDEEQHRFFCQVTKLLEFASQIAKGMQYLHSENLIHFDLAARNVLVVAPNKVRITDFGLARVLCQDEKKILLRKPIAVAWCAPELFKNQLATKGCDVWSYGVLLWELLSLGEQPWQGLSIEQIKEQADIPDKILPQPHACSDAIYSDIMQECWKQEPDDRPNFTKIIECLNKAKPAVASAKNTVWTVRPKELKFQKGTKITIIDRNGTNKYLCQNDKAELGSVKEENISFKIEPIELTLNKPKISSPFNMRHTNSVAILKKHKETGVFPVEVENLVALAAKDPQANISVESKPCSSQAVQKDKGSEGAGHALDTLMDGGRQHVDHEKKSVESGVSKRNLVPPPIPKRVDISEQTQFSYSNTLPAKRIKPPVPKPRNIRPKSTYVEKQDSHFKRVITIDRPTDDIKESKQCSSVKPEGEENSFPQCKEEIQEVNSFMYKEKEHEHKLEINKTEQSAQTEPNNRQTNVDNLADLIDLISFDKEPVSSSLPIRDSHPQGACKETFPSLPSLPVTATNDTTDSAKEMPSYHSEAREGLLIDLALHENVEKQKEDATHDNVPPPLPPKDIISRKVEDLVPRPVPVVQESLPGTCVLNSSQFQPLWSPILVSQTPTSMQSTYASVSNHTIDPSTLTYPSSYLNELTSGSDRPVYSRPFPTTLPKLPPPRQIGKWKPRSQSESSVEKKAAYGDEINEGIAKIQLEFPGISKDDCYVKILEYKGDIDQIVKVFQVCNLANLTEKEANFHLGHCAWDVQRTVNYIFDNMA